jgi:hypothetical protein
MGHASISCLQAGSSVSSVHATAYEAIFAIFGERATLEGWPQNPARRILPDAPRPRPLPGQKTPGLSTRTRAATAPLLAALAASFPADISLLAF